MSNANLGNLDDSEQKPTGGMPPYRALFVDLDGTLIEGDLLRSACLKALGRPGLWPACVAWSLRGRAHLKDRLSAKVAHDAGCLRFRETVLELIRTRKAAGDHVVLASATAQRWADAVAEHLGCFDDVLASTVNLNLKGSRKLAAIQEYCRDHAIRRFGYVGDALADLPIWSAGDDVYVVPGRLGVLSRVQALGKPFVVVGEQVMSRSPVAH